MSARAAKTLGDSALKLHVLVKGLPRTALPNDLMRLCGKAKVEHVSHVALNYKRFEPTGSAMLSFQRPEYVPAAVKALNGAVLGGKTIKAEPTANYEKQRTRGKRGFLQAAERGAITGDGPEAAMSGRGKSVVLYGLPGKMVPGLLADNLRSFQIVGREQGKPMVTKLNSPLASTSRFLVRLESASEAHRLVRALHMRYFRPDINKDKYVMHAAVVS